MSITKFLQDMYHRYGTDDNHIEQAVKWEHELHILYWKNPEEFCESCEQLGIDISTNDFQDLEEWDKDWGPE